MKETTKYLLQAIGSIAAEVRAIKVATITNNENILKQITLSDYILSNQKESNKDLKDKMETRLTAIQISLHEHFRYLLSEQESMLRKIMKPIESKSVEKRKVVQKKKRKVKK